MCDTLNAVNTVCPSWVVLMGGNLPQAHFSTWINMSRWRMDYASVDFWMKTQLIYRPTFTFLTLLTSPHLVFSLVPKNNGTWGPSVRRWRLDAQNLYRQRLVSVIGKQKIVHVFIEIDANIPPKDMVITVHIFPKITQLYVLKDFSFFFRYKNKFRRHCREA